MKEEKRTISEDDLIKNYFDEDQNRSHASEEEAKKALHILKAGRMYWLNKEFLNLLKENKAVFYKGYTTEDGLHNVIYCYSLEEKNNGGRWYGGSRISIDIKQGYLC